MSYSYIRAAVSCLALPLTRLTFDFQDRLSFIGPEEFIQTFAMKDPLENHKVPLVLENRAHAITRHRCFIQSCGCDVDFLPTFEGLFSCLSALGSQ